MKFRLIIAFLSFQFLLSAQIDTGFYFYVNTGYKQGSVVTLFVDDKRMEANLLSNAYLPIGGGNTLSAGLGRMITDNFGAEVSATYTSGWKKQISNYHPLYTQFDKQIQSTTFHMAGSLVIQTRIFKTALLYAKAGIVINLIGQSFIDTRYMEASKFKDFEYKYSANMMSGFNGSFGVLIPISTNSFLMIEAEEVSVQGSFKQADLIKNNTNSVMFNQIYFVENTQGYPANSAKKFPVSYSCIGFNIGILHKF